MAKMMAMATTPLTMTAVLSPPAGGARQCLCMMVHGGVVLYLDKVLHDRHAACI